MTGEKVKNISLQEEELSRTGIYAPLIRKYCEFLVEHFKDRLVSICIFGSVATGKANKESDIDVLVIAQRLAVDLNERLQEHSYIRRRLRSTQEYHILANQGFSALISCILLTPQEAKAHPPIFLDITEEGLIIYDRDGFLADEIKAIKERLCELGSRRVQTEKGYYWVLKPGMQPGEVIEI